MFSFARNKHFTTKIGGFLLSATLMSSAALITTTANASGSFGGGSKIGVHNSYNLGKSLFHKKLICSSCPASEFGMNKSSAQKLINNLEINQEFASNLNTKNRVAVIEYLTRRFQVN